MANPNIVAVATINGKTAVANVTTTATAIVTNSAASNKVFKVNALIVSNIDGTNNAEISVDLYRDSVAYYIVRTVVVPADASVDIISRSIYLQEGDSLRVAASANDDLQVVCSYEEIS
jgi:uncharacterized protein YajQ (UPF0234 family)